ncbi:MAG: hypothetical protein MJ099_06090, partial [Clostridia bacterium]|nr:hypothetical protein [Clostridia bacterium]
SNGSVLPVSAGTSGTVRVEIGSSDQGTFTVSYRSTPIRKAALTVSAAAALGLAIVLILRKKRCRSREI